MTGKDCYIREGQNAMPIGDGFRMPEKGRWFTKQGREERDTGITF